MKISIIIPTIGRSTLKLVIEALLSNNNFDHYDVEVLIVFDGEVVNGQWSIVNSEFEQKVKTLQTGKKAYAAGARNLGLEHATGDIVAFIGDDTIPQPDWLERLVSWHTAHPASNQALLGRVAWTDELAADPFHQWLEQKALFDYARLDRGAQPSWRHFYTSNVSVKRELLVNSKQRTADSEIQNPKSKIQNLELFSTEFTGWGFEDSEFGYRLSQAGMQLHYDPQLIVKHDDPQTLSGLIKRTQQARANAQVFEDLHPEIKILPRGAKLYGLKFVVWILGFLNFPQRVVRWREWKKAWLGGFESNL